MLLYFVNMGILLALLTKLLYKPLLKFMDERRELVRRNLQETELLKAKFEEETRRRELENRAAMERMQSDVVAAKTSAEARAKELIAEADKRREEMMEEARRDIEEAKSQILKEAEKETQKRIEDTVMHVLRNKIPADVVKASVQSAWKELHG